MERSSRDVAAMATLINVEPGLVNLQKTSKNYGKSTAFLMGTSTNYITSFNSFLYVDQRVYA